MDVFEENMNKIVTNFPTFPRKNMLTMTNDEKMECSAARVYNLCGKKLNWEDKIFRKVRDHCLYAGKYWGADIYQVICNTKNIVIFQH